MAKRRDLFDPADPAHMTPKQRLAEIAAILARGVIRMRKRRQRAAAAMQGFRSESGQICLELFRRSSPDGQCG